MSVPIMTTSEVSLLELDGSVSPLFDEICWAADWSSLCNLSMEFGKPRIVVHREPLKSKSRNKEVRRIASRRLVSVRGDWQIWIYHAYWRIVRSGKVLTTGSSSYRKKFDANQELKGQQPMGIYVCDKNGATRFEFDLDTVLEVRRMGRHSKDELWLLYGSDGYQRSVRGNGVFSREKCEPTGLIKGVSGRFRNSCALTSAGKMDRN